jgi:hypothetical protein
MSETGREREGGEREREWGGWEGAREGERERKGGKDIMSGFVFSPCP